MNITIKKSPVVMLPTDADYEKIPNFITSDGLHTTTEFATEYEFVKILYWLIVAKGHKRILEIGTNKGHGTYWLLKAAEKTGGSVITVDPENLYQGIESERLTRINKKSTDFFESLVDTDEFDFIYVDGDHSFIMAYYDIYSAQRRISKGGTIAVHDTRYNEGNHVYQVDKALLEVMRDTKGSWTMYPCGHGMAIGEF